MTTQTSPTTARASVGWPILIGALLMRLILLFAGKAILTPLLGSYNRALTFTSVTIVAVDLITIAVAARLLRRQGRSLREVIDARWRDAGWALLCLVILAAAFLIAMFIGNLVAYQGPPALGDPLNPPLWLGVWALVVMPVTIAIAEELLYRGWALPELSTRVGGVGAVLISAFFFSLQHVALTPLDLRAQLARFVTLFLLGLVFGLLYRWRKRLWPLIVAHWLFDVIGLGLPLLFAALA